MASSSHRVNWNWLAPSIMNIPEYSFNRVPIVSPVFRSNSSGSNNEFDASRLSLEASAQPLQDGNLPDGYSQLGQSLGISEGSPKYDFIREHEGFSPTAYYDVNGYAVGYGQHTINGKPVTKDTKLTKEQADAMWGDAVKPYADRAKQILPNASSSQHEALTSYIFNHGVNSPRVSKLDRMFRAHSPDIANYWLASNTSNGKYSANLAKRRREELDLFNRN